jgi:secreted protein with Ig-like and vWFA domain
MPNTSRFLAIFACLAVAACESSTEIVGTVTYAGTLTGAKEKPTATTSTATGSAQIVARSDGTMSYTVTWTGLTGVVTGAHIHGPADTANVAPILLDFSALPSGATNQVITLGATGSASGDVDVRSGAVITTTVTADSLMKLFNAGLLYVNVHTVANAAGEIRAQLIKQ